MGPFENRALTVRGALVVFAVVVLPPAVFYAGVLFSDQCLVTSSQNLMYPWAYGKSPEDLLSERSFRWDATLNYYPRRWLIHQAFERGDLPLWNPHTASGMPLLADFQSAVYYPPNLVLNYGDPLRAMGSAVFLHIVLAGLGTYAYLRRSRLPHASAILGGVAFMWSGFLTTRVGHPTMVQAAAWLPWIFLGVDGVVDSGKRLWYVALAGVTALAVLSGFPQVTVHSLAAGLLYLVYRVAVGRARWSVVLWAVGFAAVGVGLAGVQILPTLEFARQSGRVSEALAESVWRTPLVSLVNLVVPGFTGNPVEDTNWIGILKGPEAHPNDIGLAAYVGVVPLVLALAALARLRRDREVRFFFMLAVLAALAAFLRPVFSVLYLFVPGAGWAQADRVAFLLSFALAVLGARGLAALSAPGRFLDLGVGRAAIGVASVLLVGVGILWVSMGPVLARISTSVGPLILSGTWNRSLSPRMWLFLTDDLSGWVQYERLEILPSALFLGAALFLGITVCRGCGRRYVLWAAVGLAMIDLIPFARAYYTPQSISDVRREPPGVRFVREQQTPAAPSRVVRAFSDQVLPPNFNAVLGIDDAQGYNALMVDRYGQLFDVMSPGSYAQRKKIDAPVRVETFASPILDLLNVEYVLAEPSPEVARVLRSAEKASGGDLGLLYDRDLIVYRNVDVLPRVLWAEKGKMEAGPREIQAAMTHPRYDPKRVCLIEAPLGDVPWWSLQGGGEGRARLVRRSPSHVVIETSSASPGWVRWAETFYPGWRVEVDGIETLSWQSELALRSIPVPAGTHRVTLRMDPVSTRAGLGLTLVSAVLVVLLALSLPTARPWTFEAT